MFTAFFYLLRERGLDVSLNEWMTLLEGLEKGLHQSSLTGFYRLCRTVLIKSEADYDRFDQTFLEYFKDVPFRGELPEELMDWLDHPSADLGRTLEGLRKLGFPEETIEELLKQLEERLREQDSEHNGGSFWIGTQGTSPFGNGGWHPNGIRIGGRSQYRSAMMVAGERSFRDFRKDNVLDTRQFQMAFRLLRQLSAQADSDEKELDVDGTIRDTGDNAGMLKLRYKKPRKNTVKVLMFMDSGGSMDYYAGLCSRLFQAAVKSNHFKQLQIYYFHNCVYEEVYEGPRLWQGESVSTEWVLNNYDVDYRVIIVGDAAMNPYELMGRQYNWSTGEHTDAGIVWLRRLKDRFPHIIWLNPEPMPDRSDFWTRTHEQLAKEFSMYDLTAEGLEQAMKKLMVRR